MRPEQPCLFCGGDPSDPNHHCDGRQGAREAHEPWGKTRSTDEAMDVLAATRRRLIDTGREVAVELIQIHGTTHSRAVLQEMEWRGELNEVDRRLKDFWLGAVFRRTDFHWTGEWYVYSDDSVSLGRGTRHNIHERRVKVWTLAA